MAKSQSLVQLPLACAVRLSNGPRGENLWPALSGWLCFSYMNQCQWRQWPPPYLCIRVLLWPWEMQHDPGDCTSTGVLLRHVPHTLCYTVQQQSPLSLSGKSLFTLLLSSGGKTSVSKTVWFLPLADFLLQVSFGGGWLNHKQSSSQPSTLSCAWSYSGPWKAQLPATECSTKSRSLFCCLVQSSPLPGEERFNV